MLVCIFLGGWFVIRNCFGMNTVVRVEMWVREWRSWENGSGPEQLDEDLEMWDDLLQSRMKMMPPLLFATIRWNANVGL